MKNKHFFCLLLTCLIFFKTYPLHAAEIKQAPGKTHDEKKGVQFVREGDKIVKELQDKNDDGKPDVTITYEKGKRHRGEGSSRFDGKIDTWMIYSAEGVLKQTAKDKNGDGKPDQFTTMLKGRNLMLKENDRNFNGLIDQRKLVTWSAEKLKVPGQAPVPGYVSLWTEEDNNFDGKIDRYTEKGNKNASKEKVGKPIDSQVAPVREEAEAAQPSSAGGGEGDPALRKIKQMNDQHGVKTQN